MYIMISLLPDKESCVSPTHRPKLQLQLSSGSTLS